MILTRKHTQEMGGSLLSTDLCNVVEKVVQPFQCLGKSAMHYRLSSLPMAHTPAVCVCVCVCVCSSLRKHMLMDN